MSLHTIDEPLEDTWFGPYRVLHKIAGGGMAEIFEAERASTPGRRFALKRIRSDKSDDAGFRTMLVDEARIASYLRHANIARVLGLEEYGGQLGLILEYVDGVDLIKVGRTLRDRGEKLGVDVAIHVLFQVLEGLSYAHFVTDEQNEPLHVIHRDISPGNIMIDVSGRVRIVDWGIARAKNRIAQTEAGNVKGKFRYMAPEQISQLPIGPYTDVYATAITFWELMSGRRAYDGLEVPQLMIKVANGDAPSLREARPNVPPDLEEVYLRATARRIEDRYPTAREFLDALSRIPLPVDHGIAKQELARLPLRARILDSRRGLENAVRRARDAMSNDLEDVLLKALEAPDHVERVEINSEITSAESIRERI